MYKYTGDRWRSRVTTSCDGDRRNGARDRVSQNPKWGHYSLEVCPLTLTHGCELAAVALETIDKQWMLSMRCGHSYIYVYPFTTGIVFQGQLIK